MSPAEAGRALAADAPRITPAQAAEAARIIAAGS